MKNISRRGALTGAAAVVTVAATVGTPMALAGSHTRHVIEIKGFSFKPKKLDVKPGDIVAWINKDAAPHTATGNGKKWDTGKLTKGKEAEVVVEAGMKQDYFCRFHPKMKAKLIIG